MILFLSFSLVDKVFLWKSRVSVLSFLGPLSTCYIHNALSHLFLHLSFWLFVPAAHRVLVLIWCIHEIFQNKDFTADERFFFCSPAPFHSLYPSFVLFRPCALQSLQASDSPLYADIINELEPSPASAAPWLQFHATSHQNSTYWQLFVRYISWWKVTRGSKSKDELTDEKSWEEKVHWCGNDDGSNATPIRIKSNAKKEARLRGRTKKHRTNGKVLNKKSIEWKRYTWKTGERCR